MKENDLLKKHKVAKDLFSYNSTCVTHVQKIYGYCTHCQHDVCEKCHPNQRVGRIPTLSIMDASISAVTAVNEIQGEAAQEEDDGQEEEEMEKISVNKRNNASANPSTDSSFNRFLW